MKRSSKSIPVLALPDNVTRRTMYLGTRQVPEIDGSQGAFIAVVVVLSVLIVVCCIAVFYLLRYHEPTEQERAARRERYGRAREQALPSSSTFSTFGSVGSLSDKVKQVWQSTTGRGRGGDDGGRRGGRGWIRAGSDDEWASHSDHEGEGGSGGGGVDPDPDVHTHVGGHPRSFSVLKPGTRARGGGAMAMAVGDGVHVVESPSSDTASGFVHGYVYTDPFSKTVADGTLQRSQSPLSASSPVSSPRECASMDEGREARPHRDDHRHHSVMSNASVWTHAGSKFIEDI